MVIYLKKSKTNQECNVGGKSTAGEDADSPNSIRKIENWTIYLSYKFCNRKAIIEFFFKFLL